MTQMNQPGTISCPHCGMTYSIAAEQWPLYVGPSIACTKCGKMFAVSGGGSAAAPPPPPMPPPVIPTGAYPQQGYAPPPPQKGLGGGWIALIIICVLAVLAIPCLIALLVPSLSNVREVALRAKCSANLKQIGYAMVSYSANNKGAFPESMSQLVNTQYVTTTALVCPDSTDTLLLNPGPILTDAELVGHCSYIYVGKGWTSNNAGANTVLAYERLTDHHGKGINVLYGDTHVEWIKAQDAQALIDHLPSPPPPPPTGSP